MLLVRIRNVRTVIETFLVDETDLDLGTIILNLIKYIPKNVDDNPILTEDKLILLKTNSDLVRKELHDIIGRLDNVIDSAEFIAKYFQQLYASEQEEVDSMVCNIESFVERCENQFSELNIKLRQPAHIVTQPSTLRSVDIQWCDRYVTFKEFFHSVVVQKELFDSYVTEYNESCHDDNNFGHISEAYKDLDFTISQCDSLYKILCNR